jgi:hypothetical protein
MGQMRIRILVAGLLVVCTACSALTTNAPPAAVSRVDFDAIRENPCALLRPDQAEELGWFHGSATPSPTAGINFCSWSRSNLRGDDAYASAVAPFDLATGVSRTGATEITISGRAAARYLRGDTASVTVDLGEQRGLLVFTKTHGPNATDSAAAEALAAALLANVKV